MAESSEQGYRDGLRDGGLAALAPALGVEPDVGTPTHQLMGQRFTLTIEWLDGPPSDGHMEQARRMAREAQQRMFDRG